MGDWFQPEKYVDEETEVADAGTDEPVYAELRRGPWDLQWNREREGGKYTLPEPEHFTVKGPFIGNKRVRDDDEGWDECIGIIESEGSWDYIEM